MGMLPLFLSIPMSTYTHALLTESGFAAAFLSAEVEDGSICDNPDLNDPFRKEEIHAGEERPMNLTAHVNSRRGSIEIALFEKAQQRTLSVQHGSGGTVTEALCHALGQHSAFYVNENVEIALCVAALRNREVELVIKDGTIYAS